MQTPETYEANAQTALTNAIALGVDASTMIANGSKRDVATLAARVGLCFATAGINALLAVASACERH